MLINLSEGEFYCFGCGVKGNAWDFVSLVHPELSDLQVCLALEKIIRTDEVRALKVKKRAQRKSGKKRCLIEAKDYYYGLRSVDWKNPQNEEEQDALEYMMSRGFDADALNVAQCKATYDSLYPVVFPILDNGISTHTPLAGRDSEEYLSFCRVHISTHTPLAGRDLYALTTMHHHVGFLLTRPLRDVTSSSL